MATPDDDKLLIDIDNSEIHPEDIQLGQDEDGLPRTEPTEKALEAKKPVEKAKPTIDVDMLSKQLDEQKRSHEELRQAREQDRTEAQAAIDAERKARAAAEGERDKNTDLAMRAHWSRVNAEHQALESAVTSTKQLADSARAEIRAAKEAGDLDRELAASDRLIEATADLRELERGRHGAKAEVERAREAFQAAAKEPAREERKPDPKPADEPKKAPTPDEWIANCPSATQPWLHAHKEYVTDTRLRARLERYAVDWADEKGADLHDPKAVTKALNDPEFIEALDRKFFPKAKDEPDEEYETVDEEPVVAQAEKPRRSTPAAPVSRPTSSNRAAGGKTEIVLSGMEQKTALEMYPDLDRSSALKRYAKNKAMAQRDGLYESRA